MAPIYSLLAALASAGALAASGDRPSPPFFEVKAVYDDGSTVTCFAPAKRYEFSAVARTGARVKASLDPLPGYVGRSLATTIRWDVERGCYVVRTPGWTAELKALWNRLELPSTEADGASTVVPADGLRELTVLHIRPPKDSKRKR